MAGLGVLIPSMLVRIQQAQRNNTDNILQRVCINGFDYVGFFYMEFVAQW
jgi:hypothetical protein